MVLTEAEEARGTSDCIQTSSSSSSADTPTEANGDHDQGQENKDRTPKFESTTHDHEKGPAEEGDKQYEVFFSGLDDPDNPKSMTEARKWLIAIVVALSSTCV